MAEASPYDPMDTAPHDGSRVLLLVTAPDGRRVAVVGNWDLDRGAKRPAPYWTNDLELIHGRRHTRSCKPLGWKKLSLAAPGLVVSEVIRAEA